MSIRIVHGDCLGVMRGMPAASIDLLFSSPPYNIGKEYESTVPMEAYAAWIRPRAAETVRLMKPGASACWQVGNYVRHGTVFPLDYLYLPLLQELGLTLRHRVVWHFGHGLHASRRFSGRHETILWFTKGKVPYDIAATRERLGWTWDVTNVKHNHPEKTAHPCQFPEALVTPFVDAVAPARGTLIDPFFGAGTVGVVAAKTGRNCIGIEKHEPYVEVARARIAGAVDILSGSINIEVVA